eukprot:1188194-Prorocentrum_minimum.AAC.5
MGATPSPPPRRRSTPRGAPSDTRTLAVHDLGSENLKTRRFSGRPEEQWGPLWGRRSENPGSPGAPERCWRRFRI